VSIVPLDEFLTVDELAAELRQPKPTIYLMNSRGDGPPRLKIGRRVVYRRSDVEKWLKTRYVDVAAA
jgi:excisionase family DNA binding protein